MRNKDIELINERYQGQWEVFPKESHNIPSGKYSGTQSGYVLTVEGNDVELTEGIRGNNFPFNVEVKDDGRILLSYQ